MRKNLTLSFGVRHEVQNHVPGQLNVARVLVLSGRRRKMDRSRFAAARVFSTTGLQRRCTNKRCASTANDSET